MSFIKYIYSQKRTELIELSEKEYIDSLVNTSPEKAKRAYEKAWETRNFEIEMY
ncbi:TPA: hypothetical protein RRF02_004063, partial [Klebsiella pneumoniae]|nr:hypothetical protein [Klebsiella pneumoniae]